MTDFAVIPTRMVLVNVDIQNCFVEGAAPDSLVVLERINHLAEVCRKADIVVFHARNALPAGFDPGGLVRSFPL